MIEGTGNGSKLMEERETKKYSHDSQCDQERERERQGKREKGREKLKEKDIDRMLRHFRTARSKD